MPGLEPGFGVRGEICSSGSFRDRLVPPSGTE